jgi:hypothetical protein
MSDQTAEMYRQVTKELMWTTLVRSLASARRSNEDKPSESRGTRTDAVVDDVGVALPEQRDVKFNTAEHNFSNAHWFGGSSHFVSNM